jgi:hypothetical protein
VVGAGPPGHDPGHPPAGRRCATASTPCSSRAAPWATSCSTAGARAGDAHGQRGAGRPHRRRHQPAQGHPRQHRHAGPGPHPPDRRPRVEYYLNLDVPTGPACSPRSPASSAATGVDPLDGAGGPRRRGPLIFITHRARERDCRPPCRAARARRGPTAWAASCVSIGAETEPAVKYVSTRGAAPVLDFGDVLLAGLARDGGLYVPESVAQLGADRRRPRPPTPYADRGHRGHVALRRGTDRPGRVRGHRRRRLRHLRPPRGVTPLVDLARDDLWLLELFHGPTLAFKDVALQLVGRLFDHELPGGASGSRSSAPPPATPARRPSRPAATATPSTSSSCTRTAGCPRCSAAR